MWIKKNMAEDALKLKRIYLDTLSSLKDKY